MSIQEIRDKELNRLKDDMWDTLFEIEKLSHKYDDDDNTTEALRERMDTIETIASKARIELRVNTIDSLDEYQ